MWLCEAKGFPALAWASPTDMSGKYGATQVKCQLISADPPIDSNPGLIRDLQRIWSLLEL